MMKVKMNTNDLRPPLSKAPSEKEKMSSSNLFKKNFSLKNFLLLRRKEEKYSGSTERDELFYEEDRVMNNNNSVNDKEIREKDRDAPCHSNYKTKSLLPLWQDVESWCKDSPERAREEVRTVVWGRETECLPIHICLTMDPPVSTVKALIKAYPKSLAFEDSTYQALPLHFALLFDLNPEVIETLIEASIESVGKTDKEGNLPLHTACSFASEKSIKIVLNAYKEGMCITNLKQRLPLHLLCMRRDASLSALIALAEVNTKSLSSPDYDGELPIHLAIMYRAPLGVVQFLHSARPRSVFIKDIHGNTPKDLARNSGFENTLVALKDYYTRGSAPKKIAKGVLSKYYSLAEALPTKKISPIMVCRRKSVKRD